MIDWIFVYIRALHEEVSGAISRSRIYRLCKILVDTTGRLWMGPDKTPYPQNAPHSHTTYGVAAGGQGSLVA